MTAQIGDLLIYQHKEYEIVAIQNEWPFDPHTSFGVTPVAMSSACWRGYICEYSVNSRGLKLKNIAIGLEEPIAINGVEAKVSKDGMDFYSKVNVPIDYSGGIVIATNFLPEYYVHMGFQAPYAFETVYELILENGKLKYVIDQSYNMAQLRETLEVDGDHGNLIDFITSAFTLDYTDKWI